MSHPIERDAELQARLGNDTVVLRARIAELEKNLKACQDTAADTWGVLVREANARIAALEPEYDRMCLAVLAAEKMLNAANARADAAENALDANWGQRLVTAEARLADATALVMDAAVDMPVRCVNWYRKYRAFLSGQPAAPDFVSDAIHSACAKLGMSPAVADKLAEPPTRPSTDQAILDAAEAFYDVKDDKDDERAFDRLMTAVHARREAAK